MGGLWPSDVIVGSSEDSGLHFSFLLSALIRKYTTVQGGIKIKERDIPTFWYVVTIILF
jgi:hypothetical protein